MNLQHSEFCPSVRAFKEYLLHAYYEADTGWGGREVLIEFFILVQRDRVKKRKKEKEGKRERNRGREERREGRGKEGGSCLPWLVLGRAI